MRTAVTIIKPDTHTQAVAWLLGIELTEGTMSREFDAGQSMTGGTLYIGYSVISIDASTTAIDLMMEEQKAWDHLMADETSEEEVAAAWTVYLGRKNRGSMANWKANK